MVGLYPLPSTENIKTKCDGARLIPSRFAEGLITAQIPTIVCSGEVQVAVILPPNCAPPNIHLAGKDRRHFADQQLLDHPPQHHWRPLTQHV